MADASVPCFRVDAAEPRIPGDSIVVLANGRQFDPRRSRWDGPLDHEELAHCRARGLPVGFDTAQIGWVLLESAASDVAPINAGAPAQAPLDHALQGLLTTLQPLLQSLTEGRLDRPTVERHVWHAADAVGADVVRDTDLELAVQLHWMLLDRLATAIARAGGRPAVGGAASLDSAGITFRAWTGDDVPTHRALLDDPAVWEHLPEAYPSGYTERTSRDLIDIANAAVGHTVVAVGVDGGLVGQCLVRADRTASALRVGEVAYWLGHKYWGQGIMSRALPRFVDICFRHDHFDALYAWIRSDNAASARVAERAGFRRDGFARERELAERTGHAGFERWVLLRPR